MLGQCSTTKLQPSHNSKYFLISFVICLWATEYLQVCCWSFKYWVIF
jgi:hypothetical protein